MESLKDRSNANMLEWEKQKKKVTTILVSVISVILFVFIVYFIWNSVRTRHYTGYDVLDSFERVDAGTVAYEYYDGDILKYSRDGIAGINEDGETLWNGSYEMSSPIVDRCGSYVAVCDKGQKEVYIYNGSDEGTMVTMPLPVSMIKVAAQGVFAAVLMDNGSEIIALYNPYAATDQLLVEVPSNIGDDGYPVDIALSEDAKSLVIVFVSAKDGAQGGKVRFYNFSEVGQDKSRIVMEKVYDGSMAVSAEFIGKDTAAIFLDNGFSVFSNMKNPEEKSTVTFKKNIKSAFYDDGYVGFVFSDNGDGGAYGMLLYNDLGENVLETPVDFDYSSVYMNDGEIFFLSAMECMIMRTSGSTKLSAEFDTKMDYMFKGKDNETYYLIDDKVISKVKLKE